MKEHRLSEIDRLLHVRRAKTMTFPIWLWYMFGRIHDGKSATAQDLLLHSTQGVVFPKILATTK